ncbi:Os06g0113950 [Oryza sativa Japonica Group]|uniref:Os06g0113950 protein n=2 Tax=Oryza sativa subsp. japonica TaxID=39947 RepID=C7J3X9_ORYSJ|nr:Os06g0113950 [Oryza sativa Japonica Group]BAS95816.1 Os06g0113950 [Oryza sativa Japonica Group]|eukprot:NP_001174566.1 Os06g0113950 [Oryza sativa Japonica Group]
MISLSNWRLKVSSKEKKFWVEDALNAMEVLWLVPTIVHIRSGESYCCCWCLYSFEAGI